MVESKRVGVFFSMMYFEMVIARKWPLFHMPREYDPFLRSGQDAWQGPYLNPCHYQADIYLFF